MQWITVLFSLAYSFVPRWQIRQQEASEERGEEPRTLIPLAADAGTVASAKVGLTADKTRIHLAAIGDGVPEVLFGAQDLGGVLVPLPYRCSDRHTAPAVEVTAENRAAFARALGAGDPRRVALGWWYNYPHVHGEYQLWLAPASVKAVALGHLERYAPTVFKPSFLAQNLGYSRDTAAREALHQAVESITDPATNSGGVEALRAFAAAGVVTYDPSVTTVAPYGDQVDALIAAAAAVDLEEAGAKAALEVREDPATAEAPLEA